MGYIKPLLLNTLIDPSRKRFWFQSVWIQFRCLADEKSVKQRISSIQSIEKITKAMKMVASSKIRLDLAQRDVMQRFAEPFLQLQSKVVAFSANLTDQALSKPLVCLSVFSEKGLCGGVNASVARAVQLLVDLPVHNNRDILLYTFGEQAQVLRVKPNVKFQRTFTRAPRNSMGFTIASIIAERLLNALQMRDGRGVIVYNHFKNLITYETKIRELVHFDAMNKLFLESGVLTEPDDPQTLSNLFQFYVAVSVYQAIVDNNASEQSNRISSMDNASKNASDMLTQLKQKCNTARQIKTTMELIEIISGASALEG